MALSTIGHTQGESVLLRKITLSDSRVTGLLAHPSTPDLYFYILANGSVVLANLATSSSVWSVQALKPLRGHEKNTVLGFSAISADGKILAVGQSSKQEIVIIKVSDGSIVNRLIDVKSTSPGILGMQFSHDNRLLFVSQWRDRSFAVWDIEANQEISRVRDEPPIGSIFLPDPTLSVVSLAQTTMAVDVYSRGSRIWNYKTGEVVKRLSTPRLDPFSDPARISASALSEDGRYAALFLSHKDESEKRIFGLAIQNNETGRIEAKTILNVSGDHFVWVRADFQKMSITGFAAGSFFSWEALSGQSPYVYQPSEQWIHPQFGWPSHIPFQGQLLSSGINYISIVDTGVVGLWELQK